LSVMKRLKDEIRSIALLMLYFSTWIGVLALLKTLILMEYRIQFHGLALALLGALILAKAVLMLEHVPLGAYIRKRPAIFDVILRTVLCAFGVFVLVVIEKAVEGRAEHGGFVSSLFWVFQSVDGYHVGANVICISGALLGYNVLSVLRRHLGEGVLLRMLLEPLPNGGERRSSKT